VGFALVSNNISVHNEVVSEVEQNGDLVMQRILRTAKEGGRIAYPLSNQAGNELLITSGNPEKEILFYLHGDRIAVVENGVASFLSTGEVTMDSLSFLHYGAPESVEGLSVVFRAANTAIANSVRAGQYTKIFRGTATLPPGGCAINADCTAAPFTTCCEGLCRPSCGSCTSHSDCATGNVCCVEGGAATCKAAGSCATPQCDDVADCPVTASSCDLANCNYKVPTCSANACTTQIVGVCPQCSYCGDGRHDPFKGEECDDGNGVNTDACLTRCRFARCGDGARQPLGKNGAAGGGDDEECDDGNANDDDGCDSACQDENLCSGGVPDGTRTGDEQCDDGDGGADACDSFCRITVCGDGTIQDPNGRGQSEECDDGNALAGDLCSPTCLTVTVDECGNGIRETGEDCDDGKRCTTAGQPCQFDADCPGVWNLCRGANIDGCTTPSGCTATQTPESTCNDSIDNDCDNLIDCADTGNCPAGTSCGSNGRQCAAGTCACPGGQASESTCNDSSDNDCDGAVDCADSNCNGLVCAVGKTCQSGTCQGGGGLSAKSSGSFAESCGISECSWGPSVSKIDASDDQYAQTWLDCGGMRTCNVNAMNFGFSIPLGATINGVEVRVELGHTYGTPTDYEVRLIKGGTISGDSRAMAGTWPLADTYRTYGSPADTWGLTLTPADINDVNFGATIRADGGVDADGDPRVDHVEVIIYYTE